MNTYSDKNPPKSGTGKKIYSQLKDAGFDVFDLHYNENNWGNNREGGWGSWVAVISMTGSKVDDLFTGAFFTGLTEDTGKAYLENTTAPYGTILVEEIKIRIAGGRR